MAAYPTFPLVIIGRKHGFAITVQGTYTRMRFPKCQTSTVDKTSKTS